MKIPWVILFDPTTACNLRCKGCWASEYDRALNLTYDDMDTLVDQAFCNDLLACENILLVLSIEGFETATDGRRGTGVFNRVIQAMDLMRKNGLVFGNSICYTRENISAVTSDEFLDFLIDKGEAFSWYFHYMPVGNDASPELIPTPEQRVYVPSYLGNPGI